MPRLPPNPSIYTKICLLQPHKIWVSLHGYFYWNERVRENRGLLMNCRWWEKLFRPKIQSCLLAAGVLLGSRRKSWQHPDNGDEDNCDWKLWEAREIEEEKEPRIEGLT